jgi:hypothetical protein
MKRHQASVTVEGRGIRVAPDPLVMTTDDELHWGSSGSHRFTIEFDGKGPFSARRSVTMWRRRHGAKLRGRFKYTVVLESDPTVRLDPEIIVNPPPPYRAVARLEHPARFAGAVFTAPALLVAVLRRVLASRI